MLNLPYTYDIIPVDETKKKARMQLGMGAANILEKMRDLMIEQAIERWENS